MNQNLVLRLGGISILLALLQIIPTIGLVDERSVPRLSTIVSELAERLQTAPFWATFFDTIQTWFTGLVIASVAGIFIGIVVGSTPILQRYLHTTIEFLRPIPSVALIPLAILLFGTGMESTLLIVVYASFWPIFLQMTDGVRDSDPLLADTARMFRFSLRSKMYEVSWKSALPYALTGFRLSASISLILTITGELLIGTPGLGQMLATAQQSGAITTTYAIVFICGILGIAVNLLTRVLERRALHWHVSVRSEISAR